MRISDWRSDVCSSDLSQLAADQACGEASEYPPGGIVGMEHAQAGVEHVDADRGGVDEAARQRGVFARSVLHAYPRGAPAPHAAVIAPGRNRDVKKASRLDRKSKRLNSSH